MTIGTINIEIYIKECQQKGLLPFLRSHFVQTLYWPDLAQCHYSNQTLEWYRANGVKIVTKDLNSPNCSELRPIERYWTIIKTKLRKGFKEAQNLIDFQRKWKLAASQVSDATVQVMMRDVKSKVWRFSRQSEGQ